MKMAAAAAAGGGGLGPNVFDQLPVKNIASCNTLISGYAQNGLRDETLTCFRRMQEASICPNVMTYVFVLKACSTVGSLKIGKDIDAVLRKKGVLLNDLVLCTTLIVMYAKCGAIERAQEVFNQIAEPDVVTWTALIAGYAQVGCGDEALNCFRLMNDAGVSPNVVTYVSVLKACASVCSLDVGENIDAEIRKKGLLLKNVTLGNALLGMYSKCGALGKAKEVFEELPVRDIVSWNTLITGYVQNGLGNEVLQCYAEMRAAGISLDGVTYSCILKACGMVGSSNIGEGIDAEIRQQGLLQKDVALGNALIDMYSKCGVPWKAREVFQQLPMRNVVSWSALITGYVQHGLGEEALNCFKEMQNTGIRPNSVTYICILKACAILGSLENGQDIDARVRKHQLLQDDVVLSTALVDMYAKCGALEKAREIFEQVSVHNIVCWCALISGYAQLGQVKVVFDMYRKMIIEGIEPNSIFFIVLITACSHAGLVKEGENLFDQMYAAFGLVPTLDHYTCLIDLFGRAGYFDKVKILLDKAPHSGCLPFHVALLGACRKWTNVQLGRWAFERSILIDDKCDAAYVCMEHIYTDAGMKSEADNIEVLRMKNTMQTTATSSG